MPSYGSVDRRNPTGPEDALRRILEDLTLILNTLESRALSLIGQSARGVLPAEDVVGELSSLSRELKACFRRLVELEERRDLSFAMTTALQELDKRSVWLFGKIWRHRSFLQKLSLEAELRRLAPPEAFTIYQALRDLDDEEREALGGGEAMIRALILDDCERSGAEPPASESAPAAGARQEARSGRSGRRLDKPSRPP